MTDVAEAEAGAAAAIMPLVEGMGTLHGLPTACVCERGRCELPTRDPLAFARQLDVAQPY